VTEAIKKIVPEFYDGKTKEAQVIFSKNRILLNGELTPKLDVSSTFSGLNNFEPKYSIEESSEDGAYMIILEVPSLDTLRILAADAELPNHWACIVAGEILQEKNNKILKSTRQFGKFSKKFEIPNYCKRAKPQQEAINGIVVLKFLRSSEEFDIMAETKL